MKGDFAHVVCPDNVPRIELKIKNKENNANSSSTEIFKNETGIKNIGSLNAAGQSWLK